MVHFVHRLFNYFIFKFTLALVQAGIPIVLYDANGIQGFIHGNFKQETGAALEMLQIISGT
jgi:hypothetical protein